MAQHFGTTFQWTLASWYHNIHSNKNTIGVHHYRDVIMGAMVSQITSLTITYSTVYSGADQRKHQSSASLNFVRWFHRWPVNSPHKRPVTRKVFPFDDVFMIVYVPWTQKPPESSNLRIENNAQMTKGCIVEGSVLLPCRKLARRSLQKKMHRFLLNLSRNGNMLLIPSAMFHFYLALIQIIPVVLWMYRFANNVCGFRSQTREITLTAPI